MNMGCDVMVNLLDNKYEIIRGKENFDSEIVKSFFTDYFLLFDYILGDYAYDKLRLKGFYDSNNKKVKDFNNINNLDDYIKKYCAYGARIFVLKKLKK